MLLQFRISMKILIDCNINLFVKHPSPPRKTRGQLLVIVNAPLKY